MTLRPSRQNLVFLNRGHFQAAAIILEELGPEAEDEICDHLSEVARANDEEGAHLWLCVLAALYELQSTHCPTGLVH
jgi:predicted Zn-ribbon and HTH transcriptional regulator